LVVSFISSNFVVTKNLNIMPAGYEKMKKEFISRGMSTKAAETKAAKIWNSTHSGKETVGKGRK
jgi:hypothetical protein